MTVRCHLDEVTRTDLHGWAIDTASPYAPVLLEVWVNGRFQGVVVANRFRPDLKDAQLGDGRHAFEYRLAARHAQGPALAIELRHFPSGEPLASASTG